MDVPEEVLARSLSALRARGPEQVLDLVADSDLDPAPLAARPRRLRFRADACVLDLVVTESPGARLLQLLARLSPPSPCTMRAVTLGRDLTVPTAARRSDQQGVAKLEGLPHGITSVRVERPGGQPALRTAWVRL